MLRISTAFLVAVLAAPSLVAGARIAPAATTPAETVNWTAGVNYTYDGSGNIRQIGNDRFVYDLTGRLVQADINDVTRTYQYDAFGNRTGCTHMPGTASQSDCQFGIGIEPASNRMRNVEYDGAGNVETFAGHRYTYDEANMVKRDDGPRTREFVYNAEDERIAVYDVGRDWTWSLRDFDNKVLREFTSNSSFSTWTLKRDHVFRDGSLLASRHVSNETPVTYHYHLDHLGTPRRVTDHNNRTVGFHDFLAFGPEVSGGLTEAFASSLRYTGHERDELSPGGLDTLDYMHARYYSPMVGRFLGVDIELGDPAAPQTLNRYAYGSNNPFKYVDPDGNKQTIFERAAAATERAGAKMRAFGARLNDGSAAGIALDATLASVGDIVGGSGDMLRVGIGTGEAIGSGASGHDLTIAISQDVGRASAIVLTLAAPANGWIEGRAAATGATAGSKAGTCVECAKNFIARNPGATPVQAPSQTFGHWGAKTADGKKIFDPTLRDNLKAMGQKYRDITPGQKFFTPKEWERLTKRFDEKRMRPAGACISGTPTCR